MLGPDIEHHDKVAEVYFRQAFSIHAQDKLIRRIDWVCDQVKGLRILDIGCSQGIVPYLLAREDRKIIGIDVDVLALEYAEGLKAKLDKKVSNSIHFKYADIFDEDNQSLGSFDTVVLTEIIEHFHSPIDLVQKACTLLEEGGRLIITTPFGLNRAPDHKYTFYNSRLEEVLKDTGGVDYFDIVDGYYRIVIKKDVAQKLSFESELQVIQENYLERLENEYQDKILEQKAKLIKLQGISKTVTELREENKRLKLLDSNSPSVQHLIEELVLTTDSINSSLKDVQFHERCNAELTKRNDLYIKNIEDIKKRNFELENELKLRQVEVSDLIQLKFENQVLIKNLSEELSLTNNEKLSYVKKYRDIRDSFSYKFGRRVIDGFVNFGLKTLLIPFGIAVDLVTLIGMKFNRKAIRGSNSNEALVCDAELTDKGNPPQDSDYKKVSISEKSKAESYLTILNSGFGIPSKTEELSYVKEDLSFYICHMALPILNNGYATRTHNLIKAIEASGERLRVYTRLGYPFDLSKLRAELKKYPSPDQKLPLYEYDEVSYHLLTFDDLRMNNLSISNYLHAYAEAIIEQALIYKPKRLFAASDYRNGIAALIAGRKLGIPVTYEVRGLWHITRASKDANFINSIEYKFIDYMESTAVSHADKVFTITSAVRDYFGDNGCPTEHIDILPNGINGEHYAPSKLGTRRDLIKKYDLEGKIVLGYIGSIVEYEGLSFLLQSLCKLVEDGIANITLLIIGSGEYIEQLKKESLELDLDAFVEFVGAVPYEEVPGYYSVIDIAPFPRMPLKVCELVSPIKPLEAMAYGKVVVVSSVHALAEMVTHGETGLVFEKGSVDSLTEVLKSLINDRDKFNQLSVSAKKHALSKRTWEVIVNDKLLTTNQLK